MCQAEDSCSSIALSKHRCSDVHFQPRQRNWVASWAGGVPWGRSRLSFLLSYFLRFIDGLASLAVNFCVMLQTQDVLGVLLNFAALHFLQDIDDIFYVLVEQGFFGEGMEEMTAICKKITWPRRHHNDKSRVSSIVMQLDTVLFFLTFTAMFAAFLATTILNLRSN